MIDKDGNIVSLIQSLYGSFGSGLVAPGTGIMLHNRGGLFTLDEKHPNALAPRKRPLHTIIPAFMQKGDVKIGFGIMGGFNQAQAHAQFVADIADYGLDIQQALEAGRFTKGSFTGCDVQVEALVPGEGEERVEGARPRRAGRPAAQRHVRIRAGGDERRRRRAFRRVRAAPRRRRDSRSAAGVHKDVAAIAAARGKEGDLFHRLWNLNKRPGG